MKNKFFDKWNNIGTYSVKLSTYFEVYEHILTPFLQKKIMIFFAKKLKFLKRIKFVNLIVIKPHSILDLYLRKKQNRKCKIFFKNEFKE